MKKCHLLKERKGEGTKEGGREAEREGLNGKTDLTAADPNVKYIQLIMTFIRFSHAAFRARLPAGKHSPAG